MVDDATDLRRSADLDGIAMQPSNLVFGAKTAVWILMIALGAGGTVSFDGISALPFQILLALAFVHGVELEHQALHLSGFRGQALNRFFGVCFGVPMLVSFSAYQASHMHHHRALGTPEDKEFWDYGDISKVSFLTLAVHFLILKHYARALVAFGRTLTGQDFPDTTAEQSKKMRRNYAVMILTILGLAVLSALTDSALILKVWLVPLVGFAGPIHALIELPEHYGCNKDSTDVFQNTRSIRSNAFMAWFTNGNNFHVEHHYHAAMPVESQRQLNDRIGSRIVNATPTYRQFYLAFLRDLVQGRKALGSVPS